MKSSHCCDRIEPPNQYPTMPPHTPMQTLTRMATKTIRANGQWPTDGD